MQLIQKTSCWAKSIKRISQGRFTQVYKVLNSKTGIQVAVKIQPVNSKYPSLIYQYKLLSYLHNDLTVIDKGVPNIYYCSTEGDYNVLVMDLMGPSLQSLFNQTQKKFSLKTVLMLIDQIITRIQYIHHRYFIHRDIKPDNFCIGLNQTSNKIFISAFELSKRYIQKDGTHINYKKGKKFSFTPRYASINAHMGIEQARRDDMESIGYICMYFLKGMLPWQGLKAQNKAEKLEKIKEKKIKTSVEVLCKGYPEQFAKYLHHIRGLKFDERPNYQQMKKMFKQLFQRNQYNFDFQYDWVPSNEKPQKLNKIYEFEKQQSRKI